VGTFYVTNGKEAFPWLLHPTPFLTIYVSVSFQTQNCRRVAIQERLTAVLRSIPKQAFADSFQKLYERCQPCVVKDCDYFEGQ
jgi:hypothetical protein